MQSSSKSAPRRTRRSLSLAALAAVPLVNACTAHAGSNYFWAYGVTNGSWSNGYNWDTTQGGTSAGIAPGVSTSGDIALLYNSSPSVARTVTLDTSISLHEVQVDLGFTLLQNQARNITTDGEDLSNGGIHNQSAGTNTYNGVLEIDFGQYYLSGGTININSAAYGIDGIWAGTSSGPAIFNQSGGTITLGTSSSLVPIYLGFNGNSFAQYKLQSGSLTVNGNEYLGDGAIGSGTYNTGAVGSFTQSGGTNTVGSLPYTVQQSLYLGYGATDSGTYAISGGTLTSGGFIYVGYNGTGSFTQTGGTVNVGLSVVIGNLTGSTGSYEIDSGTLNSTGVYIGAYGGAPPGAGTFLEKGGLVSTGEFSVFSGSATISGGVLTTPAFGVEGAFHQQGGEVDLIWPNRTGFLYVDDFGTYSLSAGTLAMGADEEMGEDQSAGTFNQTGGSNTVQSLQVGASGGTGFYNLSAGTLTSTTASYVGNGGAGTLTQTGGTHVANSLYLGSNVAVGSNGGEGYSPDGSGTYSLSAGTLTVSGNEYVGISGSGTFNQSGGTATVANLLIGGNQPGYTGGAGAGTYLLSGGSLSGTSELVGATGVGTFTHTAGTNTVSSTLTIAYWTGSKGSYSLGGTGSLSVASYEAIGQGGLGTFNQSGGNNTIGSSSSSGSLYLGIFNTDTDQPGTGTYQLSGGALTIGGPAGKLYVGDPYPISPAQSGTTSVGSFTQSGGVLTINGNHDSLQLGEGTGSIGTFTLSSGTLNSTGGEDIGAYGTGNFYQTGGTNNIVETDYEGITVQGPQSNPSSYNLVGPGSLSSSTGEYLGGSDGPGLFTQSAGTNTTNFIGLTFGSTYTLSGGSVIDGSLGIYEDTPGQSSTFNQSGGVFTIGTQAAPGSVDIGEYSPSGGSPAIYNLIGTGNLTVNGNVILGSYTYNNNNVATATGIGELFITGGTMVVTGTTQVLSTSTLTLNGGSLATGTLDLSGIPSLLKWTSGTLSLTNSGLIVGSGGLFGGTLSLAAGKTLNVSGAEEAGIVAGDGASILQTGGTHMVGLTTVPQTLYLGLNTSASYNLSGTGSFVDTGDEIVGWSGAGNFSQSGGTNTLGSALSPWHLYIGFYGGSSGTYSLSGTGTATINGSVYVGGSNSGSGGNGTLAISGGAMSVSNTLQVWSTGTLNLSGGSLTTHSLVNAGALTVSGGTLTATTGIVNNTLATVSGGAITPTTFDGTGTLSVKNSAMLTSTHIRQNALTIASGSTVTIADSTSGPGNTASTSILTDLNNSGTLDLKNNDLIIKDTTQFTAVQYAIISGYDFGQWAGVGISSSSAKAKPNSYGLGYATAGAIGTTSFDGQTGLASGTVLVKYTLLGDTKLTGSVGLGDYNTVLANLNTGTLWSQGAFHPGATTGLGDYNAVLANFNTTATGSVAAPSITAAATIKAASIPVSPAIVTSNAATDLKLEVNTVSGDVFAVATTATALTGYDIFDSSNNLKDSGDPNTDLNELLLSQPTTNRGNTTTFRNATNYKLWTTILDNASTLAEGENNGKLKQGTASTYDTINVPSGGTIDFGHVYATATNKQDLTFSFSEADPTNAGNPVTGTTYGGEVDYVGTPEPTTLGLLGLGGVTMLRRHRRRRS